MGSISRQDRSQRFIDEFEDDIVPHASVHAGMHMTVQRVRLGFNDREEVVIVADLQGFGGLPEITVELGEGAIYDPDYEDDIDTADALYASYNIEDAEARLEKVSQPETTAE